MTTNQITVSEAQYFLAAKELEQDHQKSAEALFQKELSNVGRYLGERMAGRRLLYVGEGNTPEQRRARSSALEVLGGYTAKRELVPIVDTAYDALPRRGIACQTKITGNICQQQEEPIAGEAQYVQQRGHHVHKNCLATFTARNHGNSLHVLSDDDITSSNTKSPTTGLPDQRTMDADWERFQKAHEEEELKRELQERSRYRNQTMDWHNSREVKLQQEAEKAERAKMRELSQLHQARVQQEHQEEQWQQELYSMISFSDRLYMAMLRDGSISNPSRKDGCEAAKLLADVTLSPRPSASTGKVSLSSPPTVAGNHHQLLPGPTPTQRQLF